jgi:hypothetical protein
MALAGHAFFVSGLFGSATFAADCTPEQDMLLHPWGLNHVTNRYLKGSRFVLHPECEDMTRTQKVELIAQHEDALRSVTFCKNRKVRPKNCGVCQKCLRTKAMFAATIGAQPGIFLDPAFGWEQLSSLDLSDRTERAFFLDVYQEARARGRLTPQLQTRFEDAFLKSDGGRKKSKTMTNRLLRLLGMQ